METRFGEIKKDKSKFHSTALQPLTNESHLCLQHQTIFIPQQYACQTEFFPISWTCPGFSIFLLTILWIIPHVYLTTSTLFLTQIKATFSQRSCLILISIPYPPNTHHHHHTTITTTKLNMTLNYCLQYLEPSLGLFSGT